MDDFTFCQGDLLADEDQLGSPKPMPRVSDLSIHDESDSAKHGEPKVPSDTNSKIIQVSPPKVKIPEMQETATAKVSAFKQPVSIAKPVRRAKVPFEKGHSQMDWLKLTQTHPDLAVHVRDTSGVYPPRIWHARYGVSAVNVSPRCSVSGLKGSSNRRLISMDEVKQHKSEGDIWTVLKGCVYNISPYMKFHPGGEDMLMKATGKDCTALFNKYHAWVNAEFLLEKCLVGFLDVPT